MFCPKCKSGVLSTIPAEIRLYRNTPRTLSHPPLASHPDVHVCLDCGFSEFSIPTTWISAWLHPMLRSKEVASSGGPVAVTELRRRTA